MKKILNSIVTGCILVSFAVIILCIWGIITLNLFYKIEATSGVIIILCFLFYGAIEHSEKSLK